MRNRNPYKLGEIIFVRAWWIPDHRIVKGQVIEADPPDWHTPPQIFVTIKPWLQGPGGGVAYGHSRFIAGKDIVDCREIIQ